MSCTLLVILLVSAFMLIRLLVSYARNRRAYDALEQSVLSTGAPAATEEPAVTPQPITGSVPWAQEDGAQTEIDLTVDWEQLRSLNRYAVAWLYCADTNISYPVVQYKDNEYYLTHNFERQEDDSGTLFFDYRNALSESWENWIIYGHRRNDHSMFGSLSKFARPEYYETHPRMYLLMEDRTYRVEIFCCRTVHAEARYFTLWFNSAEEYGQYLSRALEQSYWQPSFEPGTDYPILTLATCSTYNGDDEPRLLVQGRLVPIG